MHIVTTVIASLLLGIGLYGAIAGLLGLVSRSLAGKIGARLAGTSSYLSMATLGLLGFVAGAVLIMTLSDAPWLWSAISGGMLLTLMIGLGVETGLSPAILFRFLSKVRVRIDPDRRIDLKDRSSWFVSKLREETYDEKIENTIATAGILGVGVTAINAALLARLFDVGFSSAEAVFGLVCFALVATTVFAAGALARFDSGF